MENNPQVAVMMPVYNGEKTLGLALSSLVHQTYTNWKCYIVNDGSTDGTKEILDGLTDPRFVIIHFEQNKGRPYARQAALDAAEGKYLAFLDADDFYHPEKLELQVNVLNQIPVTLVSCGNACFDAERKLKSERGLGSSKIIKYKSASTPIMAMRTSMVLLSISKKIKFDPHLKYAQDTDFLIKYLSIAKLYLIQDKILYYYSEYDSVSKKKVIQTYFFVLTIIRKNKMGFISKAKEYIKIALKILIYIILTPFVSVDFFLDRRGNKPSSEMTIEFNKIIDQLMKK